MVELEIELEERLRSLGWDELKERVLVGSVEAWWLVLLAAEPEARWI